MKTVDVSILGTMPDRQAARVLGITRRQAVAARVQAGIPLYDPYRGVHLSEGRDSEIARQLGVTRGAVWSARNVRANPRKPGRSLNASELALLGTDTDARVAVLLGATCHQVEAWRVAHGIHTANKWLDEEVALLGTDTDKKVGDLVGRSRNAVALARWQRGIPAFVRPKPDMV